MTLKHPAATRTHLTMLWKCLGLHQCLLECATLTSLVSWP